MNTGDDDLAQLREERETMERWRAYSCHVIAELLEVCAVCGKVMEKDKLTPCRLCHDTYHCKTGTCLYQHHAKAHPVETLWIR